MKKVLLTSTALVMTAGVAAAEMSMSAGASLVYGNFGTGHSRAGDTAVNAAPSGAAVPDATYSSEASLTVSGSGGGGALSYSGSLEIEQGDSVGVGPITISSGGLTFVYDANDVAGLVETGADGEDDNIADYSVSYSAGGLSASYVADADTANSDDTLITLGYAMGDLTIGLEMEENSDGTGGVTTATTTVGYVMGDATISLSAADDDTWDASVAYVSGNTTMTLAADENSIYSAALAYTSGDMTFSARQEFNGTAAGDSETEFGLTYAAGDLTFTAAYDSGNADHYGDEAETIVSASYAIDGATIAAKANDQDEVELSVGFSF
jgi:outer membrane protein OmpU